MTQTLKKQSGTERLYFTEGKHWIIIKYWEICSYFRRAAGDRKTGGFTMTAILGSFLQYLIIMVLLAAIGVAGAFTGKKLRERKDEKTAAMSAEDTQ